MKDRSMRFLKVVDSIGDNDSLVCKNIGIIKETLSKVRTNVQDVSIETLTKFCNFYTNSNANYILTGIGNPIFKNDKTENVSIGVDNICSGIGNQQMLKEASSSPPNSDAASIYKELYEKKEAELAVSQKRIEELIEHNARLEQELKVFITKKTDVPETESVSDAAEILKPTGTGDL